MVSILCNVYVRIYLYVVRVCVCVFTSKCPRGCPRAFFLKQKCVLFVVKVKTMHTFYFNVILKKLFINFNFAAGYVVNMKAPHNAFVSAHVLFNTSFSSAALHISSEDCCTCVNHAFRKRFRKFCLQISVIDDCWW